MNAQDLKDTLGASTTELARLCGVHRMTMQKWLTGERPPSAAVLRLFDLIAWLDEHGHLKQAMRDLDDAEEAAGHGPGLRGR
jgi:DNA-binding transcriptional regulator YiaG